MNDAPPVGRRAIRRRQTPLRVPLALDRYLEACRAKGAITQEQRANLLGIIRNSVSRYEIGLVEPTVSSAVQIAARLDVTVEHLWPLPAADLPVEGLCTAA